MWFPLSELAWDLDFNSLPKLRPYVDQLVEDGWVLRKNSRGQDYYCVPDPYEVLDGILKVKLVDEERLEELDSFSEALNQATFSEVLAGAIVRRKPKMFGGGLIEAGAPSDQSAASVSGPHLRKRKIDLNDL